MRITVTGGHSGVGRATASAMATAGHEVVIACRVLEKGYEATETPAVDIEVRELDLGDRIRDRVLSVVSNATCEKRRSPRSSQAPTRFSGWPSAGRSAPREARSDG